MANTANAGRTHTQGWSRREWLGLMTTGALGGVALLQGQTTRTLGVQLYTVRDLLPKQAAETLKAIAAIGYKELEFAGRADLAKLAAVGKDLGLASISTHIEASLVMGEKGAPPDAAAQARAFEEIRTLGPTYAVVAYLQRGDRPKDAAGWRKFGEQMNQAGKVAKAAGVALAYHNHGFEFEALPAGGRPLDVLIETFDPGLVQFELDVFWVGITGADPIALIAKLGTQVTLLHLKDKAKGAPVETDEGKVARTTFVEVGSGTLDFPAILKAAKAAGVQHLFVEQDHAPGNPIESLEKSYAYLSRLT